MKRINKLGVLVALACSCTFFSSFLYRKKLLTFVSMTHQSDLIVLGKIVNIDNNVYHLSVERQLKGEDHKQDLALEEFHPWFCDSKKHYYVVGNRFLLFLHRYENGLWHTISGSTGELLVSQENEILWAGKRFGVDTVMQTIPLSLKYYQQSGRECYYPICDAATLDSLMHCNRFFGYIKELQDAAIFFLGFREYQEEERKWQSMEEEKNNH